MSSLDEQMFKEYLKYVNDSTLHLLCVNKLGKHEDEQVNSVAITKDNKFIVTGSYDKTVKIWNKETREEEN